MTSRQDDTYKNNYITQIKIQVPIHYTTRSHKLQLEGLMIKRCHQVIRSPTVQQHVEKVFWWNLNDIILVEQIVMNI